jgi:dienelactone hydrolase
MTLRPTRLIVLIVLVLLAPVSVLAAGVEARFDLTSPNGGPFPSDRFTVLDLSQNTFLRVNMPKPPACSATPAPPPTSVPTDCFDLDEINTLDGFNLQPRVRIPFTGAIDPTTVPGNVFLLRLSLIGPLQRTEVNQIVWDATSNTLFAESDELLEQHTSYLLVVTDGVRDASGNRVKATQAFKDDDSRDLAVKLYRTALSFALARAHVRGAKVVAASLFTTQSATAVLEKIRDQIKATSPAPATILADVPRLTTVAITFNRQTGTATFTPSTLPLALFDPGTQIGRLVFGRFSSPNYLSADQYLPPVGTRTGTPTPFGTPDVSFNLFLPTGTPPAGGWPVAIFGHGFGDNKLGAPFVVAASFAAQGIASIAINVVGHGGGPNGTLTVVPGPTFSAGGRGFDQNGDGRIDATEGSGAAFPRTIVSSRDALRQTVIDLMQLVRVLETNAIPGHVFDPARIFYAGQSFGGIYGTKLLAVEPSIRAGVPNVPGGAIIEIARISPSFRALVGFALDARVPASLANRPDIIDPVLGPIPQFFENIPLRDLPPITNTDPTTIPIQEVIDNTEWVSQAGNPVAYAPHIVKSPLDGMSPKPVIFQFAKGDRTVPNPTTSALLRAGDLHSRTTYFRNDLADARVPAFPNNPHTFLTNSLPLPGTNPAVIGAALAAQAQMAAFFASNGLVAIDPDGADVLFEVPISAAQIPLLEQLNFLP